MKPHKSYPFNDGHVLEIYPDTDPINPREDCDNITTMVCFHKSYQVGDKEHKYDYDSYLSWEGLKANIVADNPGCVILPVYMLDHSGLAVNTTGFGCPWDSGQIGFIFITKEQIDANFSGNTDKAKECLVADVALYNQYVSGDCWGFVLRAPKCEHCGGPGKEVDSHWGFWGDDPMQNGMLDHLNEQFRTELATLGGE